MLKNAFLALKGGGFSTERANSNSPVRFVDVVMLLAALTVKRGTDGNC